ncbi:collagen alpha-3(VI) chain-like [Saccostrea echinata]|uniref:collagen alpha-3(VI) chain-like n=1 Tax=Saccostrea echinata TaxID=191078 RepID=UPI002A815857|nr:collagen alpha-3(VI) chain-like [Saccostrea echinata]
MIRSILFLLLFATSEETGEEKDLVFVLNTPLMMSDTDLSNAVDFIYNITDRLTIGPTNTLVAALTYSDRSTQHFSLNSYPTKGAVLSSLAALKSVNRSHDKSNPNEALETVRLTTLKGSRASSSKFVVLIVMQGPAADSRTTTKWAAEDLSADYKATLVTLGLDSLSDSDKYLMTSITQDESKTFYVIDFKFSCNVIPNVTNLIDSSADTSPIINCPDPNAVGATTTPVNDTKDDSLLLVVIGALIGTLIILALLVIAYKCVKGNAEKDLRVLKAIEVYGEARFGTSKEAFCHEEFGGSGTVGKAKSDNTEEIKSMYSTRLFLARNFANGQTTTFSNNR